MLKSLFASSPKLMFLRGADPPRGDLHKPPSPTPPEQAFNKEKPEGN
jgi:hypothetical protein